MPQIDKPIVASHTPGPWVAVGHAIEADSTEREGFTVVVGWASNDVDELNADANAHLIAAAPELLEAVKASVWWWGDNKPVEWVVASRAAIAKAEGRQP